MNQSRHSKAQSDEILIDVISDSYFNPHLSGPTL